MAEPWEQLWKTRFLKVTMRWRTTVRKGDQFEPQLRMSGAWLRRAGFARGSRVRIRVAEGILICTIAQGDEERSPARGEICFCAHLERRPVPRSRRVFYVRRVD